jgi:hypothetical protein
MSGPNSQASSDVTSTRGSPTLYGATTPHGANVITSGLTDAVEDFLVMRGDSRFAECVATGEAMELAQAVQYAHHQIQLTLGHLDDQPDHLDRPAPTNDSTPLRRKTRR